MAGNTQMNNNERGVFSLHGLIGYFIAVALLLSILAYLTVNAIMVQNREATNYYKINLNLDGLKANSPENIKHYQVVGSDKKK